jgi:acid phosphatase
MRGKLIVVGAACFLVGAIVGSQPLANLLADPPPAKAAPAPVFPMSARVGCNLYLQTAAEYRACCLTIYKSAELRLEEMTRNNKYAQPAIIMDLDETVLDNSAFQTYLYKNNFEYSDKLWEDYEANYPGDTSLIPGAFDFIKKAEKTGITVIYISNRSDRFKKSTMTVLKEQGLVRNNALDDRDGGMKDLEDRLYLKTTTSDKSARREAVAAKYKVLMLFGDNLRDFSEIFIVKRLPVNATPEECIKAIQERKSQVNEAAAHWGIDWFVLPNPVYGEWERLIKTDPIALMRPTHMTKK